MTDRCRGTVRGVVGDAWSDEEIDDVLARLQRAKDRARKADPLLHNDAAFDAAAREITRDEVTAALMEKRLQVFAARARETRAVRLAALPGDEADRLRAYDIGTERQGEWAGASVEAEGRARSIALWSMVEKGLSDDPVLRSRLVSNIRGRSDPEFERMVAREMARLNGADIPATGDAGAVKAARLFVEALEAGRRMQNAEGAWIGKITGYIGRQSHDRLRVAGGFWRELKAAGLRGAVTDWPAARLAASRRAFREWRDFIRPLLDEATFEGVEWDPTQARELKAAGLIDDIYDNSEVFLYRVWSDIVTGRHEVLEGMSDLGEFRPPAGKARSVSKSRVLQFNGPDAWMDYAERFSQGGLYGALMGDLDRAAKNSALMARWGPSPEAARAAEIERLSQAALARGDTGAVGKLHNRMRQAEFEALNGAGSAPENLRLAAVARTIRLMEVLSKLGGVVLSALSDGSLAAQRMKRAGGTYLDGYQAMLKGVTRMQGEQGRAVADALDVGARGAAAHLTTRFAASDGPMGWASYAQRLFYRVNGLEAWMDGARSGLAEMLASIWGRQSDRAWSALEVGTQEDFQRFGLGAPEWELLRRHAADGGDGRRYLTFDAVDAVDDADLLAWSGWVEGQGPREAAATAARDDLRLRFQTLTASVLDDALTEPRARETVSLTRGLKPGTVAGEAFRFFTQFLSFGQTVIGRHMAPAARGYAGQSPVALMAHLIVASTAMGYLSLQMKQLVKGRTPRSLENEEGESLAGSLFIASLLQGGGLGLYGDFLFGEANRNGLPATLSSFAGPAVSDAERLFAIVNKAVWGDEDQKADAGGDAVKFAITSAPGANLFYTRWALDYAVMWRMQEQMSPGYLERYEKRVRDREGSDFLIDPSEAVTGR
ncbi:hypothetical protein [Brevundimonas sp.]|uniref:hypothetical protein n=1 Tax=Brevundimonas sp. TaxID=1871086 RepID=UPI0028A15807|nr:hypothetical protein [Brevundimonas sp.]